MVTRIGYIIKNPIPPRDSYTYEDFLIKWDKLGHIPRDKVYPPLGLYIFKSITNIYGNDYLKKGTLINVIVGLLIIVLVIKAGAQITHSDLGVMCLGLILSTHPSLVYYSCCLLRENLYLLFAICSLFNFYSFYKKRKRIMIFFSGGCTALAFMCRYEALELFIITLVLIICSQNIRTYHKIKNIFICVSAFVLVFCIVSIIIDIPFEYYTEYIKLFKQRILQQ